MKNKILCNLNKLLNKFLKFKHSNSIEPNSNYDINSFELDIMWDDIASATISDDNNVISRAMKRNGYNGKVTSCLIILDNGCSYIPEQLSDHWEAYNDSPKIKPSSIKYIKI